MTSIIIIINVTSVQNILMYDICDTNHLLVYGIVEQRIIAIINVISILLPCQQIINMIEIIYQYLVVITFQTPY